MKRRVIHFNAQMFICDKKMYGGMVVKVRGKFLIGEKKAIVIEWL